MYRIKQVLLMGFLILSALWYWAEPTWGRWDDVFKWRVVWLQYTGVLAIAAMSAALFLAMRLPRLAQWLEGLDKSYRLHKWLGVLALGVSILHWLWVELPKWLVGWGVLSKPVRAKRPPLPTDSWEYWLNQQRHLAENVGEWAFYALVVLLFIALVQRFPYHWFRKTHLLLPLLYLALVFHTVVLVRFSTWATPLGVLLALLLGLGSVSALMSLRRRHFGYTTVHGQVSAITAYPALDSVMVEVNAPQWPPHRAGQFAFLKTEHGEGGHPFTLTTAYTANGKVGFLIKQLGDYTQRLATHLHVGDAVRLEGPYGEFTFDDASMKAQIWIGAGVGVTPFLAQMQARSTLTACPTVDFFYCVSKPLPNELKAQWEMQALAANVRLHWWVSGERGHLSWKKVQAAVQAGAQCSVWFCGGQAFGQQLRHAAHRSGLAAKDFHQEWFNLR